MHKKLRSLLQARVGWIWLAALVFCMAGLISACIWMQKDLPGGRFSAAGKIPRIVTTTPTQEFGPEALSVNSEKDETPFPSVWAESDGWQGEPSGSVQSPLPAESMPFMRQLGTPKYLPAFAHVEDGCKWIGVGGQVFDAGGAGLEGMVVFVSGTLNGQRFDRIGISAAEHVYGPGGYEIFLTDTLVQQNPSLMIRLYNIRGQPLSEAVTVAMPGSCEQNLLLLNFQHSYSLSKILLPIINN